MEDIISIITFLTVVLGLMKSFLDFILSFKKKPGNSRKRSAHNRTPSNKH